MLKISCPYKMLNYKIRNQLSYMDLTKFNIYNTQRSSTFNPYTFLLIMDLLNFIEVKTYK